MGEIISSNQPLVRFERKMPTTPVERRKQIEQFEQAFLQQPGIADSTKDAADNQTFHHHCSGVYCREFRLPAGHAVTGKVHKYACINILLEGEVTCAMGEWPEPRRLKAPFMFISGEGEKKALFAHKDSVFLTFHATEETDHEKLWDEFTFPTVKAFECYKHEMLEYKEDTT